MKKLWMFITIVLLLAGCGDGHEDAAEKGTETKGESGRTLTIAIGTDIVSFDIHNHNNTSTEAVHDNMFNYLFKRDENNVIQPELVETFDIIDDRTVEMTLKEGVTFHNGDPLTSEDVKFTLERVAADDTLQEYPNYKQIKEVEVIDDRTFRVITHEAEPSLFHRLSRLGSGILPKTYIEEEGWDNFLANPVGTGPYQFKEWVRDSKIVLTPYENYFEGVVEEWDEVVFRVIPENSTRVAELLTGGVDIAVNLPPADWERVAENEGTSVKTETSNRTIMLILRATEGYPTADLRVRQALDLAIDNKAITENVLRGGGIPTKTRVAPGNFGAEESLYNTYDYDVEKAKQLLKEAGYPDGFEMTLHSPHGRYLQDAEVAELIAGMLQAVNVDVRLELMEWSNFVEMRQAGENKDAYLIGLGNSMFDGAYSVDWYRSDRFVGETDYKNEEIDTLLEASAVNLDVDERAKQIQEIQRIAAKEVPHIMLHQETINYGVSDRIEFVPSMDEMIYAPAISRK
ncbi:peptide/nickel transport system substrate-binding protein [Evansella caseinilytica]|uniref:Peptide/nickel transport system substrate-binding protein n=1 Tax=Evansella caseinilytica TaxID=1503961 RepID=A0A1H3SRF1_9BACI|nr:ABC transporter substrate-binding protein [Evansella caseinilytica]SDZ39699.1 peptide/nickel transport system substrate-binding protein [Evansella caseinilytica]